MSCDKKFKCGYFGSEDEEGRTLMISRPGNPLFPNRGMVVHPRCESCEIAAIGREAIQTCHEAKEMGLDLMEKALGIKK